VSIVTPRFAAATALVVLVLAPVSAQNGNSAWVSWASANHHRIATVQQLEVDTFADLQFFKPLLGDRRIVQLGESGHGVAEFNHAKVRLIKFLHQQMGFDVIAFESGLYECYAANEQVTRLPDMAATTLMRNCIFGVWHTDEVLPLFEYIKSTRGTARPLTLAGFDTQMSTRLGVASRPAFFAELVRAIDPARASTVEATDRQHIDGIYTSGNAANYATTNQARLTEFYGSLELFFEQHRDVLSERFGREAPIVAEKAAYSMLRYMEQTRIGSGPSANREEGGVAIRDFGMANNLTFLANDLYQGRKIMVWAHNFHIRHDHMATAADAPPTMGKWVRERFRDQLYTIGLYMNRGTAAQNNRAVYSINPGPVDSMEWVMNSTGAPVLFMDFLFQQRHEGNSWMFNSTLQREWGVNAFRMVPRNQYDGVFFIESVKAPSYLVF
jgi:erythromycin esterase